MEYDSVAKIQRKFFRFFGNDTDDDDLTRLGEDDDEVFLLAVTEGCREAQRFMLDMGYGGWHKRSSALSWSGADDTDGGRYTTLPSDFLRAYGNDRVSCIVEANGNGWGREITHEKRNQRGPFFYFRGDRLWLARGATPPTTVYLEYHYLHPVWTTSVTIDFPMDARGLIPAQAADYAKEENWIIGDAAMELKIARALRMAKQKARSVARLTKTPRRFRSPRRAANHW